MTTAKERRSEIQKRIREAAVSEFARNGLIGTSTQMLANAAGITKAQLHYYISSKEELYQEVLGSIVSEWDDIFFLSQSNPDDPAKVIGDYIRRKVCHSIEHPQVTRLFALEIARGGSEMAEHWPELRENVARASAVIQGWIDAGKIKPVDPTLFQMNLWAVTQHVAEYEAQVRAVMGLSDGEEIDADRFIDEAKALFFAQCGLSV